MAVLRWLTGTGLRITMVAALLTSLYHVASELAVFAGRPRNFHQRLELTAVDTKFTFRGPRPPKEWNVAIASIDERAIEAYGPLPWSRAIHADLIHKLTDLGAGAIAFDMTFEQPSPQRAETAAVDRVRAITKKVGLNQAAVRIDEAAQRTRGPDRDALEASAQVINVFGRELDALRPRDPDRALAEAMEKSGRVVLGVVALSKREVDALEIDATTLQRSLSVISGSTISEYLRPDSSGLERVVRGKAVFEGGLYRKFFGVHAPTKVLAESTEHFGLINAVPDVDGVNRRMPLLSTMTGSGVLLPGLALKAVEVSRHPARVEVLGEAPFAVRVDDMQVETEVGASVTLDWYGTFDHDQMPIYSVASLLDGEVARASIENRVVFVAATAVGTHDQRVTPLERAIPGVYIHATLAQNLIDGRHFARPLYIVLFEVGVFLIIGLIAGLVMTRFEVVGQLLTALLMLAAWITLDNYVLFPTGLVAYTVLPIFQILATLLAIALWSFFVEQRERRKTKRAFGRYLAPAVMEKVLSDPETYLRLGGRRYEATVLFSDIRGFTTISEALTPEELGRLLNEYMTPMTDIVFDFDGTLDKYIGDAVMAFWGAPVEQADHAVLACRAGLKMLIVVEQLNVTFREKGLPNIAIGIGLSSGPMTIGNMGSEEHFAYTALGDRVNLGARLEGQTKDYGVDFIISDATHELVKQEMLCRELGSIRVKGKFEPVRIYELIGEASASAARVPFVEKFEAGLSQFRAREWDSAIATFEAALELAGDDGDKTSGLYISWCQEYKAEPPPDGWDGVRVATSK